MAPTMRRCSMRDFSLKSARRRRMTSRAPPASPALTMLTYSRSKHFGCLANDSLNVMPDSTSSTTSMRAFLRMPGFIWCSRMRRLRRIGRPASCRVDS